jgi:hypothetical protein
MKKAISFFQPLRPILMSICGTIALASVAGCGSHGTAHRTISAEAAPVPADIKAQITPERRSPDSTLAYTHEIQIEISRDHLSEQLDAVKNACINDTVDSCTILSINSSNDINIPSGYISMRLSPKRVDDMINLAGQHGKVASLSTSAEDLAPQMNDTANRLASLNSYRDRLNGFMTKRDMPATQLITIARELSDTQTQIDELSRTQAGLKHRIDTDLLNIRFSVPSTEYRQQQTPIADSLREFGDHFRIAIAGVIDFFAYVLPWIPVIFLVIFGIRKSWQFFKKKPAAQSST